MSNNTDYNTLQVGKDLWERMASLFLGTYRGEGDLKGKLGETKSEHSTTVADMYGEIIGQPSYGTISAAINRCIAERKNYRKYAKEAAASVHETLLTHCSTLKPPKGTDNTATFKGQRFTIIANDAEGEADRTVAAILDMIAMAPDENLLEESQKKAKNGSASKLIADLNSAKFSEQENIEGGNEYYRGAANAGSLLYDTNGIMKGILKLPAKIGRALDRNEINDAGEMYAVLTGDLPFPQSGKELKIGLSPNVVDVLVKARCQHRIAEAIGVKIAKLKKLLEAGVKDEKAVAIGNFASGQFDDSATQMRKAAESQARKEANKSFNLEIEKVPAITPTIEPEVEEVEEVEASEEVESE